MKRKVKWSKKILIKKSKAVRKCEAVDLRGRQPYRHERLELNMMSFEEALKRWGQEGAKP